MGEFIGDCFIGDCFIGDCFIGDCFIGDCDGATDSWPRVYFPVHRASILTGVGSSSVSLARSGRGGRH
jgi:hypothetical protein